MQQTPSYCTDIKLFLCIISKKKEGSNGLFCTILFRRRAIPAAVFSQPRLAQVGLTEEQAIEEYGDIDDYTSNFRPMKATLSGLPDRAFMKIMVCPKTNKLFGLHMCGDDTLEIVQGFAVVVKTGLKKADLDNTVGIHRTAEEEFVTMRTPTRKIRQTPPSELGSNDILKSIELERLANKE